MKKIKVALSLILAIVLTSIMVLPAFAAGGTSCDCGHAPVIQVRGIGETLYDADGNEIFSTENIMNAITPVIPQLAQFVLDTSKTELFLGAVKTALFDIFKPVMYDSNGVRKEKDTNANPVEITVNCSSAPVEDYMNLEGDNLSEEEKLAKALYDELGEDHVYFFTYDWTGNPIEIAKDLKEFIDEVKEQSGHKKVSINAESMGGAIVSLYIDMYGYYSIHNLVMANSAFNGLQMLGEIFTGNVNIDGQALTYLLRQEILGNAEYAQLVPYLPILEQIVPLVNNMMNDPVTKAAIYSEVFVPVFGYMPSFWCFIPTYAPEGSEVSYFDLAKEFMFGETVNNEWAPEQRMKAGPDLLRIINKIGDASRNTDEIVRDMSGYTYILDLGFFGQQEIVVKPAINSYANVTNYNRYIAPVTPSANWNSDGVIEAYNASGWATVADMGYNLGENYIQAVPGDVNYVSPDSVVDASTCQSPDNTWFIKNLGHVSYGLNDGVADFYVWLLTATEEQTIATNAEYPQFMYYDPSIPELMTWEEKAENDADGGLNLPTIGLPGLPDIDLDGLSTALEQILKGLDDMGIDLENLDLGSIDLSALTGLLGTLGGVVGSLGEMLGGLLGGLGGGTDTPPAAEPDNSADEAPAEDPAPAPTPAPETNTNTNTSHVGSSSVDRNTQTTGLVLSGEPVFSSGSSTWIILFVIAAVIAGILIIKL